MIKIDNKIKTNLTQQFNNNNKLNSEENNKIIKDIKLKEQAKQLEGIFITQIVKSMESTIPKNEESTSNSLSNMMFSSVMGEAMTKGGGIGLSRIIYNSLKNKDIDISETLQEINSDSNINSSHSININQKVF